MPAGVISISTPSLSSGPSLGLLLVLVGLRRLGLGAAEHRARAGVLAHEPQAAAAAREQVADDLLEVRGRRGEGLLEGLLDAAVGVADQALELAQRGLEVLALAFELLDVLERLLVLLLRERVDRAELLAAALEALDAGGERVALAVGERLGRRLGREPELLGERARAGARRPAAWSRACCARTSPRVTSSPRCLSRACTRDSSAAHSRSSAASFSPAARSAASSASSASTRVRMTALASASRASARRAAVGCERLVALEPAALVLEPPRALAERSRSARSASRCSVLIADSTWARRSALGPSSGGGAALLDDPARVPLGLGGLVAGAGGGAGLAVDRVARLVGLGDGLLRLLDLGLGGALGLGGDLDLLDELVAAVALGEHAVGAAGRDLAQLAGAPATRRGRPS